MERDYLTSQCDDPYETWFYSLFFFVAGPALTAALIASWLRCVL